MRLNAEAQRLVQAIADATGETPSDTVTEALRQRYARLEQCNGSASVDEILAISGRVSAHVKRPYINHDALLYDEDGLPK
jgi:antitoxin VapB